jgi:diguanylate cyclase (GGDEF)-like protein/PAS domain S-box-containing protein
VFLGLPAIAPRFAHRYGLGLGALGVALAMLTLGAGISVVPWGLLADRIGERRVMAAGLGLAAVALVAAALAPSRTIVLACLLAAGVGGASSSAASSRAVLTWFDSTERGLAMGIRQTALPIGAAAAAVGLPRLVSVWSVPVAIAGLGALCAITTIGVIAAMSDRNLPRGRRRSARKWHGPLHDAPLRRVTAASALLAIPQLALSSFLVVFLHSRHGWSIGDAAGLLAAVQLGGAAMRPLVGRWSDSKQNRTRPLAGAALVAGASVLALAANATSSGLPLIAALVAASVATLSWNGLASLAAGELATADATGLALGWQTSAVFIGGAIGGPALAGIVSITSWSIGFAALALPALAAAILVWPLGRTGLRHTNVADVLGRAMASMSASVCLVDIRTPGQPIFWVNRAFERMTGYPAAEALGRSWTLSEGPETDPETAGLLHDAVDRGKELRVNLRQHRRDETAYWSETFMAPVYGEDGSVTHYMSVQKDITEKVEAAARASRMAYHDALTGLPNRAQLQENLSLSLARADRHGTAVALVFFDLDRFKAVNDRYGHLAGDGLLTDAAGRWRSIAREGDVLARLGGDEFVLLLTDLPRERARLTAAGAAERYADALKLPFDVRGAPGHTVEVTTSIGIALYPSEANSPEQLVLAADADMYAHKHERHAR